MKNNSKKREGFSLIEIVISMALIAIISVGVYNGYMIMIKQTKEGEVKQESALVGKKTIEEIKSINDFDGTLTLDNKKINLNKFGDMYTTKTTNDPKYELKKQDYLLLDKDYKSCNDKSSDDYLYMEEITFIANESGLSINSTNNLLTSVDTLKLSSNDQYDEIKYNSQSEKTINHTGKLKIEIFSDKTIRISDEKDFKEEYKTTSNNFKIDNKEYNKNMEISIENYGDSVRLYLDKSQNNAFVVKKEKGKFTTIYNDLSENSQNKSGRLYDVKVEIKDKNNKSLFVGYSTQNINISEH